MMTSMFVLNCALFFLMQIFTGFCQSTICFQTKQRTFCQQTHLLYIEELTYHAGSRFNSCTRNRCGPKYSYTYPLCNVKGPCRVTFLPPPSACNNYTNVKALVTYRCINEWFHNMCQETSQSNKHTSKLFLSTPNYPQLFSFSSKASCSCTVYGSNISHIRILHLRLYTNFERRTSNFVIKDGKKGIVYNKTSNEEINNEDVQSPFSAPVTIIFNHQSTSGRLLIHIRGTSLTFRCNTQPTTTTQLTTVQPDKTTQDTQSTTSTQLTTVTSPLTTSLAPDVSTVQPDETTQKTLQTTTSAVTEQSENSGSNGNTVPIIIGSIFGGVVLLVLVAIVIACCVKRKRKKRADGIDNSNRQDGKVVFNSRSIDGYRAPGDKVTFVSASTKHNRCNGYPSSNFDIPSSAAVSSTTSVNCLSGVNTPSNISNQPTSLNFSHNQNGIIIMENTDYVSADDVSHDIAQKNWFRVPTGELSDQPVARGCVTNVVYSKVNLSPKRIQNQAESPGVILEKNVNVPFDESSENRASELLQDAELEILENDLYVPFEESFAHPQSNNSQNTNNVTSDEKFNHRTNHPKKVPEYSMSSTIPSTNVPTNLGKITCVDKEVYANLQNSSGQPTTESFPHVEILENELYVPLEKSSKQQMTHRKDELLGKRDPLLSDIEILENDLYIPLESSVDPKTSAALKTSSKHSHVTGLDSLENELYVPLEESADLVKQQSPNENSINDPDYVNTSNVEGLENELYVNHLML